MPTGTVTSASGQVTADKWKLSTEKNAMNDKPTVTATLRAEKQHQRLASDSDTNTRCPMPDPCTAA